MLPEISSNPGAAVDATVPGAPVGGRVPWKPVSIQPLQSRRMYERIAEQLHNLIREMNFKPGDRLPPERELAIQLGVSRPSVREAMIALETAGYIEVLTGNGTYIRKVAEGDGDTQIPWARLSAIGPGVREQFEARQLVEPELAALAANNITEAEIDVLQAAVERSDAQFEKTGRRADEDDYLFHVTLAEGSRNTVLAALIRHMWDLRGQEMWRVLGERVCRPEHHHEIIGDRRKLIAALRARDSVTARTVMQHYLKNAEKVFFE